MIDCIFCKIANHAIPSKMVYEDDHVFVFDDINPQAPVHSLVIPKRHVASVQELGESDQALIGRLLLACTKVAKMKGLAEPGYRLVANTGKDGGQTVFHLHFHVLGGRHMAWPPG
jgi:histidine triad (HIT) family protein